MRKFLTFFLFCSFLVTGCLGTGKKSEAVQEFPESQYLTATGLGQSEPEARHQAMAELSRIFESKVFSDTMDRVKAVISSSKGEEVEQRLESNVRVVSSVELKGVKIGKTWYDKKKRQHYALAVLDKQKAGQAWMNEVKEWDRKIEGELRSAESLRGNLVSLKALRKVTAMWIEREVIVSRLTVLGFGVDSPSRYDMTKVFQAIPEIKRDMRIHVSISGKHAKIISEGIGEALGNKGYVMTAVPGEADVMISGTVKTEPVKLDNPGWEFTRAIVSLKLEDVTEKVKVTEIAENVRAGHVSYKEAVNKAVRKVSGAVTEKLIAFLEN